MLLETFYTKFPEIAEKETRVLTAYKDCEDLPKGEYAFLDLHCTDADCDCRRVMVMVLKDGKVAANISYGWENQKFYNDWLFGDKKMAKEFKGPALSATNQQSNLAPVLLGYFKEFLKDAEYAERLERHYKLFKSK